MLRDLLQKLLSQLVSALLAPPMKHLPLLRRTNAEAAELVDLAEMPVNLDQEMRIPLQSAKVCSATSPMTIALPAEEVEAVVAQGLTILRLQRPLQGYDSVRLDSSLQPMPMDEDLPAPRCTRVCSNSMIQELEMFVQYEVHRICRMPR